MKTSIEEVIKKFDWLTDAHKEDLRQELLALVESCPSEGRGYDDERESLYDLGWNHHCKIIEEWKSDNLRKE